MAPLSHQIIYIDIITRLYWQKSFLSFHYSILIFAKRMINNPNDTVAYKSNYAVQCFSEQDFMIVCLRMKSSLLPLIKQSIQTLVLSLYKLHQITHQRMPLTSSSWFSYCKNYSWFFHLDNRHSCWSLKTNGFTFYFSF